MLKDVYSFDKWARVSTISTNSKQTVLEYYHRLTGDKQQLTISTKYYKKRFLNNTVIVFAIFHSVEKIEKNLDKYLTASYF